MWNFSLVWALHMGGFQSLSLFPSNMELKAFPCVCWQLLAPRSYWDTVSLKRPRRAARSLSPACQLAFQANPTFSLCLGWIWSSPVPLGFYLWIFIYASVVLECRLSCSMGSFENVKLTMKTTKYSYWIIFPCFVLFPAVSWWGARARLATDWVPSCSPYHVCWMYTWRELMFRDQGASLDKPLPFQIPSRMTFPFPVLLIRDLKFGVSLMFSPGHAKASPGDNRLSQAYANGFLSQCVCQAVVFLCSLFDVHPA